MLQYFKENWYLALILILAVAITIYVIIKAYKAAAKTNAEREAMLKKAEYESSVVKEFKVLTKEKAQEADAKRLFDGVALNIQRVLEKEEHIEDKFSELESAQKMVYALYYFLDDTKKGLSEFYKCNSKPLTPWALTGANEIFPKEITKIIRQEYEAFDPDNESVSCTPDIISKLDEKYKEVTENFDPYPLLKKFILENIKEF